VYPVYNIVSINYKKKTLISLKEKSWKSFKHILKLNAMQSRNDKNKSHFGYTFNLVYFTY